MKCNVMYIIYNTYTYIEIHTCMLQVCNMLAFVPSLSLSHLLVAPWSAAGTIGRSRVSSGEGALPCACIQIRWTGTNGLLNKWKYNTYTTKEYILWIYLIIYVLVYIIEGSLEVKLPTIWTVEKQRWEESEETRSEERRGRCAKR